MPVGPVADVPSLAYCDEFLWAVWASCIRVNVVTRGKVMTHPGAWAGRREVFMGGVGGSRVGSGGMGRTARALLLAFALAVLSALPGGDTGPSEAAMRSGATVSDPSQQLSSGIPVVRRDLAKTPAVDAGGRFDRVESKTLQFPATVLPVVEVATRTALSERVDDVDRLRVGGIATRASVRGPPSDSVLTSI